MINKKILILVLVTCLLGRSALTQTNKQIDKTYLYFYTDKLPEFKGGADKLKSFLKQNLKWPDRFTDIQGTVLLSFIVTVDGDIVKIKVEKSLSDAFDEEAKRIVKLMPKWIPGSMGNNRVPVKIYFPIEFVISY